MHFSVFLRLSSPPGRSATAEPLCYLDSGSTDGFRPVGPMTPIAVVVILFCLLFLLVVNCVRVKYWGPILRFL